MSTFTCFHCGETFTKAAPDNVAAEAEALELWGVANAANAPDMAEICDVCFQEFMTWRRSEEGALRRAGVLPLERRNLRDMVDPRLLAWIEEVGMDVDVVLGQAAAMAGEILAREFFQGSSPIAHVRGLLGEIEDLTAAADPAGVLPGVRAIGPHTFSWGMEPGEFERIRWLLLPPGKRRREGQRLIREEIGRRRREKDRGKTNDNRTPAE